MLKNIAVWLFNLSHSMVYLDFLQMHLFEPGRIFIRELQHSFLSIRQKKKYSLKCIRKEDTIFDRLKRSEWRLFVLRILKKTCIYFMNYFSKQPKEIILDDMIMDILYICRKCFPVFGSYLLLVMRNELQLRQQFVCIFKVPPSICIELPARIPNIAINMHELSCSGA